MRKVICQICGKTFETKASRTIYCSPECKIAGVKGRRVEWERKHPNYNADYYKGKRGPWRLISEELPKVGYDMCGNRRTEKVLLWTDDGYEIAALNPAMMTFERLEEDGPATVAKLSDVKAWCQLPRPPLPQ